MKHLKRNDDSEEPLMMTSAPCPARSPSDPWYVTWPTEDLRPGTCWTCVVSDLTTAFSGCETEGVQEEWNCSRTSAGQEWLVVGRGR